MEISYIGHASFLIKTKDCRIVTDPFDAKTGMNFPKTAADIVTTSHNHYDHNNVKGVQGEPMVFDWPGEFEKNGVRIFGIQSYHDASKGSDRGENVVFKFELEGMSVVHMGDQGFVPDDKLVENIGEVDVLILPVGGAYSLDAKQAAETAKKLDPAIVIPMHYQNPKLSEDLKTALSPVEDFLKAMNAEAVQPLEKYSVKKEELGEKELEVVLLQPTA